MLCKVLSEHTCEEAMLCARQVLAVHTQRTLLDRALVLSG